jgi:FKBP-type peptidyl-prolyl cis-trans isomerase SlyD
VLDPSAASAPNGAAESAFRAWWLSGMLLDMKVGKDCVVGLEYKLHLGDGEVVDESAPGEPMTYLHGADQIVPGLEKELEGLGAGDSAQVVVAPEEGYGTHDPRGLQEVPRSAFPADAEIAPGETFGAEGPDGSPMPVTVRELKGDTVLIDLNHPLAGKTLHFDVTIREVRKATAEELEHGHAHGPGGEHDH